MYLTKEAILNADDRKYEEVEVPEWGGTLRIGTITAGEKGKYETSLFKFLPDGTRQINSKNMQNLRTRLIAACVVDETGERLFSDKDVDALDSRSSGAIERVFSACTKLNALNLDDVEEIEGNSEEGQS